MFQQGFNVIVLCSCLIIYGYWYLWVRKHTLMCTFSYICFTSRVKWCFYKDRVYCFHYGFLSESRFNKVSLQKSIRTSIKDTTHGSIIITWVAGHNSDDSITNRPFQEITFYRYGNLNNAPWNMLAMILSVFQFVTSISNQYN